MRKILTFLLITAFIFTAVSCGGDSGETDDDVNKIVIYTGGSSEFIWKEGADEEAVHKAVSDAFYADTGIKIEFEVNFMGKDMKDKVTTAIAGGNQVDIMISHIAAVQVLTTGCS